MSQGSPQRILVVDDEPTIRRLSTMVLVRAGYRVDTAGDGAEALRALHDRDYDLLITDHNMPNLLGTELLLKLHDEHVNLPVILATGQFPTEEFMRHPEIAPAATLLKPFTIADLLGTVREILPVPEATPDA
jgi:two-component system, OmpR family, alkaline phosphatase synthesis response regulator PhoP